MVNIQNRVIYILALVVFTFDHIKFQSLQAYIRALIFVTCTPEPFYYDFLQKFPFTAKQIYNSKLISFTGIFCRSIWMFYQLFVQCPAILWK